MKQSRCYIIQNLNTKQVLIDQQNLKFGSRPETLTYNEAKRLETKLKLKYGFNVPFQVQLI